jgi:glycine dehydrogenase subunit 2
VYFPLIVDEAMMIEPTETESKETLDAFADAMLAFATQADRDPESLKELRHLKVIHLDEAHAARNLNTRWVPPEEGPEPDPAHVESDPPVPNGMKPKDESQYEKSPTI